MVDLGAKGPKVVEPQVDDRVTDVRDMIELFQPGDDHVADDSRRDFRFAHGLQSGFDLAYEAIDILGRDRPFGAGDAHAPGKLFSIELFAHAVLFHDHGCGQDGPFVGAEAFVAILATPPAANCASGVVRGVNHTGLVVSAVWTMHKGHPGGARLFGARSRSLAITLPDIFGGQHHSTARKRGASREGTASLKEISTLVPPGRVRSRGGLWEVSDRSRGGLVRVTGELRRRRKARKTGAGRRGPAPVRAQSNPQAGRETARGRGEMTCTRPQLPLTPAQESRDVE